MSIANRPRHFRQQWSALTIFILIACSWQQSWAQVTINVNTTQQGLTNGQCSLQEAIYASELKSSMAIQSTSPDVLYNTGCTAGGGDGDIIVLPPGATFTFDHLWDGDAHNIFGPTATPIIFSKITIEGNGATFRWIDTFRPGNSRLFAIGKVDDPKLGSGTGELTLKNVYIKDFHVKGGDGRNGGGGGLGAGGAIFNNGRLTVENSTFEHNGAVGGDGSSGGAGGGGGLSGNGGHGCAPWAAGAGGGSRGDGGKGNLVACPSGGTGLAIDGGGGGGGGTVFSGEDGAIVGGQSGFACGGGGGGVGNDGSDAPCAGGGGGGGGGNSGPFCWLHGACAPDGGNGGDGGGGGGGLGDGGNGGFGGGGGAGHEAYFTVSGGNGGFGAGGGAAPTGIFHSPGKGGAFGGHANQYNGGGGAALGGAIFNHADGTLAVRNSTFFNNFVKRGSGGAGSAANGRDAGGAIFSLGKVLEVTDSTISGNHSTGSGAALVVYSEVPVGPPTPPNNPVAFILNNTLIANNGANECFIFFFTGSGLVNATGGGNLIMQNGSGGEFSPCPGVAIASDPQLQPLQLNGPGTTPTMAIPLNSPAVDKADPSTSLPTDQRAVPRPQGAGFDIGAFEASGGGCPEAAAFLTRANAVATINAAHAAAYTNLICGLVEDRTYQKLDALYVLATQSDGGSPGDGIAKLNLIKDNFNLVGHGSYTFAADKGTTCDGSSAYFDTQFNLANNGVAFSRDSASYGVYDRSTTNPTNGNVLGAIDNVDYTALNLDFSGGLYVRMNSLNTPPITPNSNSLGFWIGTRTGSSAVSVYKNGNEIAASNTPSSAVPSLSMYLCAANFNGAATSFVSDQIAAVFFGGGLDKTLAASISYRVNAFMAAFGTNIY